MSLIKGRHSEQLQAVINWGTDNPNQVSVLRDLYVYVCGGVHICMHTFTYTRFLN